MQFDTICCKYVNATCWIVIKYTPFVICYNVTKTIKKCISCIANAIRNAQAC